MVNTLFNKVLGETEKKKKAGVPSVGSKHFAPQGEAWSFESLPEGGVPCWGGAYGKTVPQHLPTLMWVFSFALCIGNRQLWATRDELLHVPIRMTMSAAALLDHTLGSLGCLGIARLSPLPGPVCPGFLRCCPVCARTMVVSSCLTKITPKTLGLSLCPDRVFSQGPVGPDLPPGCGVECTGPGCLPNSDWGVVRQQLPVPGSLCADC